jgi:DNA-binding XRE family transcriptional regulator
MIMHRLVRFLSLVRMISDLTVYASYVVKLTRLRALRERKVLTQQELADKAGITRATLSRLEAGAQNPYPSTIRKLASALSVEPETLMDPDG